MTTSYRLTQLVGHAVGIAIPGNSGDPFGKFLDKPGRRR
jgi:hypothetical protein